MNTSSFFLDSALEKFDDLGCNPFIVESDLNRPSAGCLENSKSNNAATTATTATAAAHLDFYNSVTINNNNNNNKTSSYYWDDQVTIPGLDTLTPELSPSLTEFSPAINSANSPYGFDGLDFEEYSPSPSIGWGSPFEESFGADQLPHESFDFDFSFRPDIANMDDFQLFPDESASLEKLLMAPTPTETESDGSIKASPVEPQLDLPIKQSPFEAQLEYDSSSAAHGSISPAELANYPDTFSTAKILGHDVLAPNARVAPRKPVQSPTKPGFQPNKRRRRRRVTSEEASRVVPDNDPEARARYQCSQCNKTFSRPFNLRSHRAIHLGVKPYACTFVNEQGATCHWAFARRHDLERHVKSRHEHCNTFSCKTCGVECARTDALKKHLARCSPQDAEDDDSAAAWVDQDMEQVSHL